MRAHERRAVTFRPGYKHFLTSNFADGKNIQFTIHILSRPTLSITVTETVLKAKVSQWWETVTMEVESESHRSQTILLSGRCTSTKAPTVATTQLSLALQQILRFHSR